MTSSEQAEQVKEFADEMKAENIEIIDVRTKTVMLDYLVICSGTSDLHVRSIADRIEERMRAAKMRARGIEGRGSGWVLLDFGDVVTHVMREEQRQFYDLESLWQRMPKSESVET